jgi:ketosteroid isomerase-like protein
MSEVAEVAMTSNPVGLVDRLARATSAHDLDGIVACFAEDYVNETPTHPRRGFLGRGQVRRNWAQVLAAVPNLTAWVLATAVDGDVVWSEWRLAGTRGDGAPHEMRGVIIFAVAGELIRTARFYLEPVEHESGTVDDAVRSAISTHEGPDST